MILLKYKFELLILIFVIFLGIFLRFWNLLGWILINGDEISVIISLGDSILYHLTQSESSLSSFFPSVILTKLFFFINSFPEYRYINATMSVISLAFVYLTTRIFLKNKILAILPLLLFSVHGVILYNSRLYLLDWTDILFPNVILFLYFTWRNKKRNILLPIIFFFCAIGINNHATLIYFFIPLFFWFTCLFYKKKIQFKWFLISIVVFLVTLTPILKGFVINLLTREFLDEKYKYCGMNFETPYFLPNVVNPGCYLGHIFLSFTSEHLGLNLLGSNPGYLFFLILFIPIPLLLYLKYSFSDKDLQFLAWISYGTFFIVFLSPVPAYTTGHALIFLIVYMYFLTKELEIDKIAIKFLVALILVLILVFNLMTISRIFTKNELKEWLKFEKYILDKNITEIPIEKTSYEYLSHSSRLMEGIDYQIFKCKQDGIDPMIFNEKNFTEGQIILFSTECEFYENYKEINLDLKHLGSFGEIRIYGVV